MGVSMTPLNKFMVFDSGASTSCLCLGSRLGISLCKAEDIESGAARGYFLVLNAVVNRSAVTLLRFGWVPTYGELCDYMRKLGYGSLPAFKAFAPVGDPQDVPADGVRLCYYLLDNYGVLMSDGVHVNK